MRRHVLPTALKDKRHKAECLRQGDILSPYPGSHLWASVSQSQTPHGHVLKPLQVSINTQTLILAVGLGPTSGKSCGADVPPVCWVQVIDTVMGQTLLEKAVTPLGSDPCSTIYHLHNFGKSPKLLMSQFPNLDNKYKSIFPMN